MPYVSSIIEDRKLVICLDCTDLIVIYLNRRFIFPALGGLLFGYDIGATSGATLSLQVILKYLFSSSYILAFRILTLCTVSYGLEQSPALSGTTWFNFSPVQLGLVVCYLEIDIFCS